MVVMAVIFALSEQGGLRVSADANVDKPFRITGHLLAYGTLSACFLFALCRGRAPRGHNALMAFGLTVLYGLLDEWHQSFVPDRSGRLDDVVTDAAGALAGLTIAWLALAWAARRREGGSEASP
jgi:VanZ family protein